MNAMCKVIIKKVLQRIVGLWFHEITHICNIYFLNPASPAKQEMLISTRFLAWYGSKNYFRWDVIIFHLILAFFLIEICRKTFIKTFINVSACVNNAKIGRIQNKEEYARNLGWNINMVYGDFFI